MIIRWLLSLFTREETAAEERDRFYNGHEEAKRWRNIIAPAASERIHFWSRHGL